VSRHPALVVSVVAAGALLAACTGGGGSGSSSPPGTASPSLSAVAATSSVPGTSTSTSAAAKPTKAPVARSLLSGRTGVKDGPVLVVKLDNTRNSEPHEGLEDADVVYLEQVEGGLTRYAAVVSTRIPRSIGPIRSARISDIDLFAQYGKVAFAYSGAQHRLRPVIAAANLYNVSGDNGPAGYRRDSSRPAPYNFFGNGPELLRRAPSAARAKDVGFRFATAVPAGGAHVSSAVVRWPGAKAVFVWNASAKRWLLTMDGLKASSDGKRLGGTTVVIQYVNIHPSSYGDKFGGVTPMSETVGSGKAVVLRDGRAYQARWSRTSKAGGTKWTTPAGRPMTFAPGQVWVLLTSKSLPATLTR
jgi:hypothetical protein